MMRVWAPVVLAFVLAGLAGGVAPAASAGAPAGPMLANTPPSSGDDCCPDGCTDCARPCCQAPVLGCFAPAPVLVAAPRAIPAPLPIVSQHASAPLRALDRPPRF